MPDSIDFSRYRMAESIAEAYAAGDSAESLARNFFATQAPATGKYLVQLIVAAHDRKGKYEPAG